MIRVLLYLLEIIPYRTKYGLSLAGELKLFYYKKIGKQKRKCLCGGRISPIDSGVGYEVICYSCDFLYDED